MAVVSAFHDVRLPEHIETEAQGGHEWKTSIAPLEGGYEQRNEEWESPLGSWDISYGIMEYDDPELALDEVIVFHRMRHGRGYSFRFKDWNDYEMDRQSIGTTDTATSTFPLRKVYSDGVGTPQVRYLTKPVSGTVRVWVDNVERALGAGVEEFQVDLLTGVVTLGATLVALSAKAVEASCEFDVPVRFDSDKLSLKTFRAKVASMPGIGIQEVRVD